MSEEKDVKTGAAAEAPVKKMRRGVSNQTQAVSQLRFHEKDAAPNGLFVGHLDEVRVDWSVNADGKSFTGMKVPRLTFHFASNHTNKEERRHVYHSLFPVESNVDTMEGGKDAWRVNNVFNWIKHMLDVFYLKGRNLTEEEEYALGLDFVDYDENTGEYIPVDPEDVLKAYANLFNNACAMLNGQFNLKDGEVAKPTYKDANGNFIKLWIKLLRHRKRKTDWINVGNNGELAFDGFIGAGVIEIQKPNVPPAILRIDLARESITPKQTNKAPSVGGLAAPNLAMPGNVIDGSFGMPANNAFAEANEEMPF